MTNTQEAGAAAERVAEAYYRNQGFELVARNYRLPRGELDLIVRKGGELLFVEVKGRREIWADEAWSQHWGRKKKKLHLAARIFLARHTEVREMADEIRLEIVYVTQGRVSEVFAGWSFF